jgi:anaerobic magnesium-protoporphyrin IX monomethyl ester cyclase
MKILFLEIDTGQKWALASVGPAFIASPIRKHGHDAVLLRFEPDCKVQDIIRGIEKELPDLLGFF